VTAGRKSLEKPYTKMTEIRGKHWTTEPTDCIDIVVQKSGVGAWTPKTVIQVLYPICYLFN